MRDEARLSFSVYGRRRLWDSDHPLHRAAGRSAASVGQSLDLALFVMTWSDKTTAESFRNANFAEIGGIRARNVVTRYGTG